MIGMQCAVKAGWTNFGQKVQVVKCCHLQLKVLEMILTRKSTILSQERQNPIESFTGGKRLSGAGWSYFLILFQLRTPGDSRDSFNCTSCLEALSTFVWKPCLRHDQQPFIDDVHSWYLVRLSLILIAENYYSIECSPIFYAGMGKSRSMLYYNSRFLFVFFFVWARFFFVGGCILGTFSQLS